MNQERQTDTVIPDLLIPSLPLASSRLLAPPPPAGTGRLLWVRCRLGVRHVAQQSITGAVACGRL